MKILSLRIQKDLPTAQKMISSLKVGSSIIVITK